MYSDTTSMQLHVFSFQIEMNRLQQRYTFPFSCSLLSHMQERLGTIKSWSHNWLKSWFGFHIKLQTAIFVSKITSEILPFDCSLLKNGILRSCLSGRQRTGVSKSVHRSISQHNTNLHKILKDETQFADLSIKACRMFISLLLLSSHSTQLPNFLHVTHHYMLRAN
jgi:hypothetical protein